VRIFIGAASLPPNVLPTLPRCRTCSARRLAAGLRASHPASGRAGVRRMGGRRRSSVSDRANASVVPAGEVTDEQVATRQVSGGWQRTRAIALAASELLPRLLLCHADAPAPLGSRQPALCCRPPSERFGLRRAPYARPGLCVDCVSRVRPTHPRLSRGRACSSRIARTCIALLRPSVGRPAAAQLL